MAKKLKPWTTREAMQEISEALNELWEQRRVEIKHDPMDIEYLAKAANEQLKEIISQDVVEQLRAENKRLRQEVQHAHNWETAADKRARELEARLADQEPRTEIRVIELIEHRLDSDHPYIEYHIQYRNHRGPWTTVPITRTQDREKYERMKGGSDD